MVYDNCRHNIMLADLADVSVLMTFDLTMTLLTLLCDNEDNVMATLEARYWHQTPQKPSAQANCPVFTSFT